jgi:hypothetical protein
MNVHNIHAHHVAVTWTCNICNRKLWPNFFSNKKVHGCQKLMRHIDAEILESVHEVQWSSVTCMLIMLLVTWTCNIATINYDLFFSTIRRYMAVKANETYCDEILESIHSCVKSICIWGLWIALRKTWNNLMRKLCHIKKEAWLPKVALAVQVIH